jgi:hypothetical protein
MKAERAWRNILNGLPQGNLPASADLQARLTQERLGNFNRAYDLLTEYSKKLPVSSESFARASFRLALYAELRHRYKTRFDLEPFERQLVPRMNQETMPELSRKFREQLGAEENRVKGYGEPADNYAQCARLEGTADARWNARSLKALLELVEKDISTEDPDDIATISNDLFALAELYALREQRLALLTEDTNQP